MVKWTAQTKVTSRCAARKSNAARVISSATIDAGQRGTSAISCRTAPTCPTRLAKNAN